MKDCKWIGCGLAFPTEIDVYNHIFRSHLPPKRPKTSPAAKCEWDSCQREFKQYSDSKDHMVTHFTQNLKPFKCKSCGVYFSYRMQVYRHAKEVHRNVSTLSSRDAEIPESSDLDAQNPAVEESFQQSPNKLIKNNVNTADIEYLFVSVTKGVTVSYFLSYCEYLEEHLNISIPSIYTKYAKESLCRFSDIHFKINGQNMFNLESYILSFTDVIAYAFQRALFLTKYSNQLKKLFTNVILKTIEELKTKATVTEDISISQQSNVSCTPALLPNLFILDAILSEFINIQKQFSTYCEYSVFDLPLTSAYYQQPSCIEVVKCARMLWGEIKEPHLSIIKIVYSSVMEMILKLVNEILLGFCSENDRAVIQQLCCNGAICGFMGLDDMGDDFEIKNPMFFTKELHNNDVEWLYLIGLRDIKSLYKAL